MGPDQVHRCLALLVALLLIFCRNASGDGLWCIASIRATEAKLGDALSYACGQGGVDCSSIQPGGSCFEPDTLFAHASWAFNSYFQADVGGIARCDFDGCATLTKYNPSTRTCDYPSTRSAAASNTSHHTGETGDKA